jgi:hypothetical protein
MPSRARRYVQCLSSSVIGLVVSILDRYHIWCIVTRLFMSPITSQSSASYRTRRLGGYRLLDLAVIGAMLTCLFVIGLAGAMVIRPIEVSKISDNITGRDGTQSSQVTGQPTDFTKNYSDYYPGLIGLRRMSLTRAPMPGQDPGRD